MYKDLRADIDALKFYQNHEERNAASHRRMYARMAAGTQYIMQIEELNVHIYIYAMAVCLSRILKNLSSLCAQFYHFKQ